MDINFDFTIVGVPNDNEAQAIANTIAQALMNHHQTDMWITYKDVTF